MCVLVRRQEGFSQATAAMVLPNAEAAAKVHKALNGSEEIKQLRIKSDALIERFEDQVFVEKRFATKKLEVTTQK